MEKKRREMNWKKYQRGGGQCGRSCHIREKKGDKERVNKILMSKGVIGEDSDITQRTIIIKMKTGRVRDTKKGKG